MASRVPGAVHPAPWIQVSQENADRWADIGGLPLIRQRRSEIEAALNDYSLCQTVEDEAPRPKGVRPIVARLRASSRALHSAVRALNAEDAANAEPERSRIRRETVHSLLSAYMSAENVSATLGVDFEKTLADIERACALVLKELPVTDNGRPPLVKGQFRSVVCMLAELFCEAGESAPALFWDHRRDSYPQTPFFLLTSAVHAHLPIGLQFPKTKKGTTFAKFVAATLADWNKQRKD